MGQLVDHSPRAARLTGGLCGTLGLDGRCGRGGPQARAATVERLHRQCAGGPAWRRRGRAGGSLRDRKCVASLGRLLPKGCRGRCPFARRSPKPRRTPSSNGTGPAIPAAKRGEDVAGRVTYGELAEVDHSGEFAAFHQRVARRNVAVDPDRRLRPIRGARGRPDRLRHRSAKRRSPTDGRRINCSTGRLPERDGRAEQSDCLVRPNRSP